MYTSLHFLTLPVRLVQQAHTGRVTVPQTPRPLQQPLKPHIIPSAMLIALVLPFNATRVRELHTEEHGTTCCTNWDTAHGGTTKQAHSPPVKAQLRAQRDTVTSSNEHHRNMRESQWDRETEFGHDMYNCN